MLDVGVCNTMYATKRRRRSVKTVKPPMKDPPKSNPSKRHRERLNSELDHLASLLPFEQSVISKLDKLSVLRLAVSYLRTKSYFQTAVHERYVLDSHRHALSHHHLYSEPGFTDTDCVLQALSGFLFVVNCDGEVFFASRTVEQYLGFHQSDIIHQSALELIHSEDRDEFKSQLNWRSQLPQDQQDLSLQQVLLPENSHYLQRCFTVRFRCLLDNTSGFITLEISGRIKLLHSQNIKTGEEPPLALFAICCPFGPLPLLDVPPRDYTFKTKHKMDMAPVSMDPRGKLLFGYSDRELVEKGGYDLLHPDDLTYYAAAHQELIKTGSSGLIAYRLMTKDFRWIWLQTSSKVIYKNSKPDFVICTHRHLTEDEGKDLVGKRGSEFKLPYPIIDADPSGLGAALEEEEYTKSKSPKSKKGKNQLRDYLQAGRKRKTPYREVYNGINGYAAYSGINGYPACQPGTEIKPEFMYPYASQNFAFDADLYRSSYPTLASTMYPNSEGFRIEADKHSYTNGYYLEPRQYQHTLQYHGNGYTDLMAQTAKYSYDMSKYGYDAVGGYSLDLAKRGHYEDDLSRYENDLRKYSDYSGDKYGRMNGTFDTYRTGSIYGTNTVLNNEGLLSCNTTSHGTSSPCSLYRSDQDRYNQSSLPKVTPSIGATSVITDCKQQTPNGHTSVIRNASPRNNKSPSLEVNGDVSAYSTDNHSILSSCTSSSWLCNNPSTVLTKSTVQTSLDTARSPLIQHSSTSLGSRIISPITAGCSAAKSLDGSSAGTADILSAHNSTSPAMAATATSVIQQPIRNRACEKQGAASGGSSSGGIAVPVVKSSSWLHHLPSAASYNWHIPSDSYGSHQGVLHPSATDSYSASHPIAAHTRTIVESPKYASTRAGEKEDIHGSHGNHPHSNPLLSFSQVTHTLLSSN